MGAGSPEPVLTEWTQNAAYRSHLVSGQYQHVGIGMVGGMWTVIGGEAMIPAGILGSQCACVDGFRGVGSMPCPTSPPTPC
jgi:hypothetical protein